MESERFVFGEIVSVKAYEKLDFELIKELWYGFCHHTSELAVLPTKEKISR